MNTTTSAKLGLYVHRPSESLKGQVIASIVSNEFSAFDFDCDNEPMVATTIDGQQIQISYLGSQSHGVSLSSDGLTEQESLIATLQGIPQFEFVIQGEIPIPSLIVDGKVIDDSQSVQVIVAEDAARSADIKRLIVHSESFSEAIGGVPASIPLPKNKTIAEPSEKLKSYSSELTLIEGMTLPFNRADQIGMVVLRKQISDSCFDAKVFANFAVERGDKLIRVVEYVSPTTGESRQFSTRVCEVRTLNDTGTNDTGTGH